MADAGDRSRIPWTRVQVLPGDQLLLLASPLTTRIIDLQAGIAVASIQHVRAEMATRVAAATLPFAASRVSGDTSQAASAPRLLRLLALVSDAKELTVHRLVYVPSSADAAGAWALEQTLTQALPKRAVKMLWEGDNSDEAGEMKRLVIGDRHGDIRR